MLTKELLKSNVNGLTDDQIATIELLSKNDEDKVIGDKVREIHDRYDQDIERVTGQRKPENTKSYVFLTDVLTDLDKKAKSGKKATELQRTIDSLTEERDKLQEQIKSGTGDEALKTQVQSLEKRLKDKEDELKTVRDTMGKEKTDLEGKLQEQQRRSVELELNHAYDAYLVENKIKFKGGIPDELLQETLANRKRQLNDSLNTDWIDDGKGGQRLVFRDEKGEVMRNPENKLEPFTPGELYIKKISDLVDPGQVQKGGGTKPPAGGGGGTPTVLDLSAAKTQVQADQVIVNHILKNEGIAKTDPRFAERQKAIREENKVADLPMREGMTAE